MARIYTIKCPKCGHVFKETKGVLMRWDFSKPIPAELQDETPFNCPECNHTMCVLDDDFEDSVIVTLYADWMACYHFLYVILYMAQTINQNTMPVLYAKIIIKRSSANTMAPVMTLWILYPKCASVYSPLVTTLRSVSRTEHIFANRLVAGKMPMEKMSRFFLMAYFNHGRRSSK